MIGKDKICAVVAAADASTMWRQLSLAVRMTSTIELRLDWLADDREISRFLARLAARRPKATLLATCRRRSAGGRYRGSIAKQLIHLADAIRAGCAWYDLEVETTSLCPPALVEVLLGQGKQLISAHFFKAMPRRLPKVEAALGKNKSDCMKIAARCESLAECRRLADFARGKRNLIVIPMGEVALPTRILLLREPNGFAYAPVENPTASGQVSLEDINSIYRAGKISRKTSVYGVIGNPIGHTLSPHLQNAGFAARRMNAIYLPFLAESLPDFVSSIAPLKIKGFSVTIPHKERILTYLADCDPLARAIGAVNTVVVRTGGKLYGYNTDYVGVLQALEKRMKLAGARVLIVGAGGAARAVAFALTEAGAAVCICARRQKKAQSIAEAVKGTLVDWNRLKSEFFDAIVNATPVGMHPFTNESPLEARDLNCRLVFDTIYRPQKTKLLQLAERKGIETVSGVEMFVAQGVAQWEIWTGERAPVEAMRRAVLAALKREEKLQEKR
ncbi:MAG TPA: shikimate dehydrogenase [Candidatus Acidoferrum sp.]|nr:shikimate dehydrogenase [Candidatus Acidoferrum sp.]